LAAWPVVAPAQQDGRVRRIGALLPYAEDDPEVPLRLTALRRELDRLGWLEGRNVRIDIRYAAARGERFSILAKHIIALQPDVILINSGPAAFALQRETRTIPIVFQGVSDPIGSGLVANLARPGGNLTGLLLLEASIAGKWSAMLKEIAPRLVRVALLANPKTSPYDYWLHTAEALAPALGIALVPLRVETADDIESAIESFAGEPNGGLALPPDSTATLNRHLIIALAARHRLPAVYPSRQFMTAGGLISCLMGLTASTIIGRRPFTLTAFCAARNPLTCRYRLRSSSRRSSTSKPPRPSASLSRKRCWPLPTR
jgi:putative ABC transport system substrate-binding protein